MAGRVLLGTGIAGLRGRLPGVEPAPYIIRFTEDRPNPLYRRVCYTVAWGEVIAFAVLNIAGLVVAIITGTWMLKEIYRYAYFPLAGTIWLLGALGSCRASSRRRPARATSGATSTARSGRSRSRSRSCGSLWRLLPRSRAVRRLQARALRRHPRGDGPPGLSRTPAADAANRARRVGVARLMR